MLRIRLDRDLRPVTEFRANAAALINQVRKTKRPVVLTQRGRGAVVLVDVEEYQKMIEVLEAPGKGRQPPPAAEPVLIGVPAPAKPRVAPADHGADAVVDAYKDGIDRSLIRENLSRPVDERLRQLTELAKFSDSLREAPRRPAVPSSGGPDGSPDPTTP